MGGGGGGGGRGGGLAARVREYAGTLVKVVWWWDKVSYFLLMLLYILLQNIVFVSIQQPGVSTDEIDEAVYSMIIENGAYPSPLGYGGFPKLKCLHFCE